MAPGLLAWRLGRAWRACPCSAASTRHVATCATIAGQPVTTMGLDAIRGAQGAVSGDRHPPSGRSGELVPGGAPGARPCAVVRRTRRRAGAVCGTAVRAGWGRPPGGVAWPAAPDRRRAGRRRRAVPTGESPPLNQSGRQGRNVDHTTRWAWARTTLGIAYHDAEWGVPVHDDRILYGATTGSCMVQQSGRDSLRESPRPGRWLAEGAHRRLRTGLTRCTFSYSPSLAG